MTLTNEQRIERLERALFGRKTKQKDRGKARRPRFKDEKRVLNKLYKTTKTTI